jgi:inhibitor of KinA
MTLKPLGDSAVVASLGTDIDDAALRRVGRLAEALEHDRPAGVVDLVPAFASVTVFYDAAQSGGYERLCAEIVARAQRMETGEVGRETRMTVIPVCYGGAGGADLAEVAAQAGLSADEVVGLHTGGDYLVQAIGFAPGFAYLGGLPERIHTPRRKTPRTEVPAGTVGIGGAQTGVYPLVTPGGWNLIGRTPLRLFDSARKEAALLRTGDRVKFRAISGEEFALWR